MANQTVRPGRDNSRTPRTRPGGVLVIFDATLRRRPLPSSTPASAGPACSTNSSIASGRLSVSTQSVHGQKSGFHSSRFFARGPELKPVNQPSPPASRLINLCFSGLDFPPKQPRQDTHDTTVIASPAPPSRRSQSTVEPREDPRHNVQDGSGHHLVRGGRAGL